MKLEKDISMIALIFFVTRCFFNLYTFINIYSFLITSISTFLILLILKKFKHNLFENKLFRYLYIIVLVIIFIIILINTAKFVNINYFKYSNYFTVILSLLTISYIIGKDNIKTISSISEICLLIFITISILISIGLFSIINTNNLKTLLYLNTISINLLPGLIIFILFYLKDTNILCGYILGNLSVLIDLLLIIGTLGNKLPLTYTYPGISILKSISFFNFINHLDRLFSFIYLFEYTITLSLIIFIIKNIIQKEKEAN